MIELLSGLTILKAALALLCIFLVWSFYQGLCSWMRRFLVKRLLEASIILSDYRYFEKRKNDIEILFLGACEFKAGIEDRIIENNAFNFSVPSAGYIEQYYFLKYFMNKMQDLKLLVLSVGDNSFCSRTATGTTFPVLFHRFLDYDEILAVSPVGKRMELLRQRWLYSSDLGALHYGRKHMRRVRGGIIRHYRERLSWGNIKRYFLGRIKGRKIPLVPRKPVAAKARGIGNKAEVASALKARYDISAMRTCRRISETSRGKTKLDPEKVECGVHRHFSHPVFDHRALLYFGKILDLCREKGVPVVTLCMPRAKDFIRTTEKSGYITEDRFLKNIPMNPEYAVKVHEHLHCLREYEDRAELFDAEGVELNKDGRRVFSEKLAVDMKRILKKLEKE